MSGLEKEGENAPIVLFTGAGASCAEGIELPNMTQFFRAIMNDAHVPSHALISEKDHFKYIMDHLYPEKTNQTYDLERVLGVLYKVSGTFADDDAFNIFFDQRLVGELYESLGARGLAVRVASNPNGGIGADQVKRFLLDALNEGFSKRKIGSANLLYEMKMLVRQTYSSFNREGAYRVYGPLFKVLIDAVNSYPPVSPKKSLPIFTTNYDLSIDYVLRPGPTQLDESFHETWLETSDVSPFEFNDGFALNRFKSRIVWSYTEHTHRHSDILNIPYHKLHGSVLWEEYGDGITKTTDPVPDNKDNPRPFVMIYPSDKSIPDKDPFGYSHRELERYLRSAKLLIVIGFAFRDPGIVDIFKRALRDNNALCVLVIGPEPASHEVDLRDFLQLDNVEHLKGYFGEPDVSDAIGVSCTKHLTSLEVAGIN